MSILYHYSPLIHLPLILRDGLTTGEIAQPTLLDRKVATAVSLTSQTDHERLFFWGGTTSLAFKTAVRFVCDIPDGDSKLEPARSVWKRLNVPPKAVKLLDSTGQSKWWFFYHGVIPPERFTVEFWGSKGYVPMTSEQLSPIVAEVSLVRDKFEFLVPPNEPWALDLRLKDESDQSPLWLLQEERPADRFLRMQP
jgi:hypothetical protein